MKKMRAYINVAKLRVNMALKREAVGNYPVEAYIEPTSFCNLRCPACPTGLRLGQRPTATLDEKLFKATIDEIGDYVFRLWMYNWGEPLLHKRTPEMIAYAKAKELRVVLSSNLSIPLTDDYVERLVASGLDTLIVGLDGVTPETYGKYRVTGNLSLVRDNMRRIQAAKSRAGSQSPHVLWQFLVFRHNEHEIEEARRVHKDWGADSIKFAPAEMPIEPYREGFEPSSLPQYNMYHDENRLLRESERQMRTGRACSWLYGTFVLNPNGKVSPCCGVSAERNDFGEYASGANFFDVWNGDKFRRARAMFANFGKGGSLNERQREEIAHRIDGMAAGVNLSLAPDELICAKCPIPFRQDDVRGTILDAAYDLMHTFAHDPSPARKLRSVVAYLLMGAPHFRDLARDLTRKLSRKSSGEQPLPTPAA
ncbi:MAG: radical SAM protein [Acidobacteriota bacterium]|nr:radical SAM protein [Acidobacteriota bacterium]